MFLRLSSAAAVGAFILLAAGNSRAETPRLVMNPHFVPGAAASSASTAPTHTAIYRKVVGEETPSPFQLARYYYGYGQYHPWLYRPRYYFPYASYPYGFGYSYPYGMSFGYAYRPYYQSYSYPYLANYGYGGFGAYGNGSGYGYGYGGGWPSMYSSFYWPGYGYPFGMGGSFGPWGGVGYSPYYAGYGGAGYGGFGYGGCYYW